ncbi:MAG: hypothetical protein JHC94_09615 [Acidimicrobiia bacterium]|nr:hypothetical protein [Acidimicrobiia bacterium]
MANRIVIGFAALAAGIEATHSWRAVETSVAPVASMLLGTVKTPFTPTAGGRVGSGVVVVVVAEIPAPPQVVDGIRALALHAGAVSVVQMVAALACIIGPIPSDAVAIAAAPAMRESRRDPFPANRISDLQVDAAVR